MAKEKHQTPTKSGTLAHIRIAGVLHQRHFRRGTDPITIKQWLLTQEMKYRRPGATRTGRFEDDATAYLQAVAAMPTIEQRKAHIEAWSTVFVGRRRDDILPDEIRTQLHLWRRTQSAASCNKRRTALMHLYSVLDGKSARNPVKDVPRFLEPAPAPRTLTAAQVKRLFAKMPASKSKARLMVIAYTGIPHAQIAQIQRVDIDLTAGTVAVPGRRKGAGTRGRLVPLTKQGVAAFRLFIREEAFGRFGRAPIRLTFLRALKRAQIAGEWRVYDLRHFFGTEVYRASGDIRATQILMDHSTERLTHRYTAGAEVARVQAAIAAVNGRRR